MCLRNVGGDECGRVFNAEMLLYLTHEHVHIDFKEGDEMKVCHFYIMVLFLENTTNLLKIGREHFKYIVYVV